MEILLSLPFVADVSIEVARSYTKQLSHWSLEGMKIEKTMIAATTVSLRSQRIQYNLPSLNKASCQTYHARQVLLTAAIKNTPVSPEKYIFLPASAFFLPFSHFHSSLIWQNPKVQNVQMNQWQAWHSVSGNSHWDSKWYFMLPGSEHSSEDPSICLTNHTWNWDFFLLLYRISAYVILNQISVISVIRSKEY